MIYTKKPKHFSPVMSVASCIFINSKKETLLLLRNQDKSEGGLWEMPGGKIDEDESMFKGLKREIYEETKVKVAENKLKHFKDFWVDTRGKQFTYHLFYTNFDTNPNIKIDNTQHTKYKWVPLNKCLKENLVSDHPACMDIFLKNLPQEVSTV